MALTTKSTKKKISIGGSATIVALFAYLVLLSQLGVQITSSGDIKCIGNSLDPCVSYINITAPPNQSLSFSPKLAVLSVADGVDYELFKKDKKGLWQPFNITGKTIKQGEKWELKLVGHKKIDQTIKWGIKVGATDLDPVWTGYNSTDFYVKLIENKADIGSGVAIFSVKNPTNMDIPLTNLSAYVSDQSHPIAVNLTFYELNNVTELKHTIDRNCSFVNVTVPENNTQETVKQCTPVDKYYNETVQKFVPLQSKLSPNQIKTIKIVGAWKPIGEYSSDWIPNLNVVDGTFTKRDWAWWNTSWNNCSNFYLADSKGLRYVDEIVKVNLSNLAFSDIKEVRIVDAACNSGGTSLPRDVLRNGANWTEVEFFANISHGQNRTYSVYSNYSAAPVPDYGDRVVDFCNAFDPGSCWINSTLTKYNFSIDITPYPLAAIANPNYNGQFIFQGTNFITTSGGATREIGLTDAGYQSFGSLVTVTNDTGRNSTWIRDCVNYTTTQGNGGRVCLANRVSYLDLSLYLNSTPNTVAAISSIQLQLPNTSDAGTDTCMSQSNLNTMCGNIGWGTSTLNRGYSVAYSNLSTTVFKTVWNESSVNNADTVARNGDKGPSMYIGATAAYDASTGAGALLLQSFNWRNFVYDNHTAINPAINEPQANISANQTYYSYLYPPNFTMGVPVAASPEIILDYDANSFFDFLSPYSPTVTSNWSETISSTNNIDVVLLELNLSQTANIAGYPYAKSFNITMVRSQGTAKTGTYIYNQTLPGGRNPLIGSYPYLAGYHSYRIIANDTTGFVNSTNPTEFQISPATTLTRVFLNATEANRYYFRARAANLTGTVNISGLGVNISVNMSGFATVSGTTPLYNYTNTSTLETNYNVTGWTMGNENYTNSSQTWYMMVMNKTVRFPSGTTIYSVNATSNNGSFSIRNQTDLVPIFNITNWGFATINVTVRLNTTVNSCLNTIWISQNRTFEPSVDFNLSTGDAVSYTVASNLTYLQSQGLWSQVTYINCPVGNTFKWNYVFGIDHDK